ISRRCAHAPSSSVTSMSCRVRKSVVSVHFFFFKQKTAYEIGLGIPAEPLFRSGDPVLYGKFHAAASCHTKQGRQQYRYKSKHLSVKVLNLFSRSRRKTNKRKSKHSAMLRNKETRHRMFIGLLNTTRKLA